jgi:hypothetical protein
MSPEFWMNLQARYELDKASDESGAAIEREVRPRPDAGGAAGVMPLSRAEARSGSKRCFHNLLEAEPDQKRPLRAVLRVVRYYQAADRNPRPLRVEWYRD